MNLIIAIIKPFKLEEVRQNLLLAGIQGITVSEVTGFGRQRGHTTLYQGVEYEIKQIPKAKIEIAAESSATNEIISIIQKSAFTNEIGDGMIFVSSLENVVRVRTGEMGRMALK